MPDFNINMKKTNPKGEVPKQATPGAAGFDLCACIETPVTIYPGETILIPTGIAMEIPLGIAGLIFARSGMASKRGLAPSNKVAVIDPDYRGEIFVSLLNHGKVQQTIEPGERIAQMLFVPYGVPQFVTVTELSGTQRGEGGFGSTGSAAPAPAPQPEPEPPAAQFDPDGAPDSDEQRADEAFAKGLAYKNGDGVEKDNEKAVAFFKTAAELGHVQAQLAVGGYYYMKNDCGEAVKWLQMAADLGNAEALFNMGVFYTEGMGVDQDLPKAADFFYRAARRRHAEAQYAYADFCAQGIGVEQDMEKAVRWFREAAEQGNMDAMFRLGQCYEEGQGVPVDFSQARQWYSAANEKGHRGATQALVMLQIKEMEQEEQKQ